MLLTLTVLVVSVVVVVIARAYKDGTIELTPATKQSVRAGANRLRHHGRRLRAWSRTGATWGPPRPTDICADHTDDRPVAARLEASDARVAELAERVGQLESAVVDLEAIVDDDGWPDGGPDSMSESDRSEDRNTDRTDNCRDSTTPYPLDVFSLSGWPNDRPGVRTRRDPLAVRVDDALRVAGPSGVTSGELADRFGVTDRQVRRVLEEIGAHRRGHRRVHPDYAVR
jgi:hypothetical protein